MSVQRTRGQPVTIYKLKTVIDDRGNSVLMPDRDNPTQARAAFIPQSASKAEVPGQQTINVTRMIVSASVPDLDVWNIVAWRDTEWDIVTPPMYHHGTRHTRHVSVDLRQRPSEVH